jgi:hypothetical protein
MYVLMSTEDDASTDCAFPDDLRAWQEQAGTVDLGCPCAG